MSDQWHYIRAGQQLGPVSAPALEQLASAGQLSPGDMVWKAGMANWIAAEKVLSIFAATSARPTAPSSPPTSPPPNASVPQIATAPGSGRSGILRLLTFVGGGCFAVGLVVGLLLGLLVSGGGSKIGGGVAGKYNSETKVDSYFELKPDGTYFGQFGKSSGHFSSEKGGKYEFEGPFITKRGKYEVEGTVMTITDDNGNREMFRIDGKTIINSKQERWTRR